MTTTTELPATIGVTHDAPSARDIEDLIRENMPMVGHLSRRTEYFAKVAQQGSLHTRLALTDSHGVPIAVAA